MSVTDKFWTFNCVILALARVLYVKDKLDVVKSVVRIDEADKFVLIKLLSVVFKATKFPVVKELMLIFPAVKLVIIEFEIVEFELTKFVKLEFVNCELVDVKSVTLRESVLITLDPKVVVWILSAKILELVVLVNLALADEMVELSNVVIVTFVANWLITLRLFVDIFVVRICVVVKLLFVMLSINAFDAVKLVVCKFVVMMLYPVTFDTCKLDIHEFVIKELVKLELVSILLSDFRESLCILAADIDVL